MSNRLRPVLGSVARERGRDGALTRRGGHRGSTVTEAVRDVLAAEGPTYTALRPVPSRQLPHGGVPVAQLLLVDGDGDAPLLSRFEGDLAESGELAQRLGSLGVRAGAEVDLDGLPARAVTGVTDRDRGVESPGVRTTDGSL